MGEQQPRRRRRAVGPPGAVPSGDEPRDESDRDESERDESDRDDDTARFLADRPPHHESRSD